MRCLVCLVTVKHQVGEDNCMRAPFSVDAANMREASDIVHSPLISPDSMYLKSYVYSLDSTTFVIAF